MEVSMYFDPSLMRSYFVAYRTILQVALRTSWLGVICAMFEGDHISDTQVQLPSMMTDWRDWRPQSLAGTLVKWSVAFPALIFMGTCLVIVSIFKTTLWLACIPFATIVILLLSCRRSGQST